MKRIVLLCILLAITFSGCAKKAAVKNTIEGNMKTYRLGCQVYTREPVTVEIPDRA